MNKRTIALLAGGAVVVIAVAAFYYFTKPGPESAPTAETPAYGTDSPLEKKPDLNPADKTNPFTGVKTNPFE